MNYKNERGFVGTWKGRNVIILEKNEYADNYDAENVFVIADDDMKVIHKHMWLGWLGNNGVITDKRVPESYIYGEKKKPVVEVREEDEFASVFTPLLLENSALDDILNSVYEGMV
ncbi:MAG: hypothetical protein IKT41_05885 [Clostridia bacterium]|nr:hypothetical protein [Clostridia bacterium]